MNNYYIVRADFYPDGNIIPLGITDRSGKTMFIDQVMKMERKSFGSDQHEYIFSCLVNREEIILRFIDNKWECFNNN